MEEDKEYLRLAIGVATASKSKGNLPFGCVLVSEKGEVLMKGENTINTDRDCLAHAEINLIISISDGSHFYSFGISYLNFVFMKS